jgi:hypothetical protein
MKLLLSLILILLIFKINTTSSPPTWLSENVFIRGKTGSNGNFQPDAGFIGTVITSPSTIKLNKLTMNIEFVQAISQQQGSQQLNPQCVNSLVVLLVKARSSFIPDPMNDIGPLMGNVQNSLPISGVNFQTQVGQVYRYSDDIIYGDVFNVLNTTGAGVPKSKISYSSNLDPNFKEIKLAAGEKLYLLVRSTFTNQGSGVQCFINHQQLFIGNINWNQSFNFEDDYEIKKIKEIKEKKFNLINKKIKNLNK